MKKEIVLKELHLINFKGAKDRKVEFHNHHTNVLGENGTGKTTISDAWHWLLFGKDSQGNTTGTNKFEVKTLDKNNNPIPKLDHEVIGVIEVDGHKITLRRVLQENWTKPKGQLEPVLKGNITKCYWNNTPQKISDYNNKIQRILDENVFKLLTNPLAFNDLHWEDRRNVLIEMFGDVSEEDLTAKDPKYKDLIQLLKQNQITIKERQNELRDTRNKIAKDLEAIPTRIDEVNRNMPEDRDFDVIREKINFKKEELAGIDEKIADKTKAQDAAIEKRNATAMEIHRLKTELQNMEFEIKREVKASQSQDTSKLDELTRKVKAKKEAIADYETAVKRFDNQIQDLEKQRDTKREEFHKENKKTFEFDDADCKCPTCKRAFEAEDIEAKKAELEANFNNNKIEALNKIQQEGGRLKEESEKLQERKEKGLSEIKTAKEDLEVLQKAFDAESKKLSDSEPTKSVEALTSEALEANEGYQEKKKQIEAKEASMEEVDQVDTSAFQEQKRVVNAAIDELKKELADEETRKNSLTRIEALEKEERELSNEIMKIEGQEFTVEKFIKMKVETLEDKINSQFKFVNFKLFNAQVNGGLSETCEALIDGVPFSAANTASKVNAGLDIISSLCEHYQINVPVFLDGRESVTEIIDIDSQIINLIVSKGQKTLKVA